MTDMNKATPARKLLEIDFPLVSEIVTAPYYTFRISAPDAASVAISVDDGDWSPCRFSIGYWWHDWSDYESGSHQVRARSCDADGAITAVESRRIDVRLHEIPEGLRKRGRHGRREAEGIDS